MRRVASRGSLRRFVPRVSASRDAGSVCPGARCGWGFFFTGVRPKSVRGARGGIAPQHGSIFFQSYPTDAINILMKKLSEYTKEIAAETKALITPTREIVDIIAHLAYTNPEFLHALLDHGMHRKRTESRQKQAKRFDYASPSNYSYE